MSQQYQIHTVRLNSNESYHPTKSGSPIERRVYLILLREHYLSLTS